jgi:hypothetical protein
MNATTTDPHAAWVTAPRDLELDRYRAYYAAKFPPPSRTVSRTPSAAAHCAPTSQEAITRHA